MCLGGVHGLCGWEMKHWTVAELHLWASWHSRCFSKDWCWLSNRQLGTHNLFNKTIIAQICWFNQYKTATLGKKHSLIKLVVEIQSHLPYILLSDCFISVWQLWIKPKTLLCAIVGRLNVFIAPQMAARSSIIQAAQQQRGVIRCD